MLPAAFFLTVVRGAVDFAERSERLTYTRGKTPRTAKVGHCAPIREKRGQPVQIRSNKRNDEIGKLA